MYGSVRATIVMAALTLSSGIALGCGTLRIGMTASDIPLTTGQTDQGGEGMRFMGYTVYDALINWDLSSFDKPSDLVRDWRRATELIRADQSKNRWIFKIREGVRFHDGSEFTANPWSGISTSCSKTTARNTTSANRRRAARALAIASYKAVDKYTLEIITKAPDASCPINSPGS